VSLAASWVFVLEIALDTVLLVILLLRLFTHDSTELIDRVVKFPVQVPPFDGEESANEAHTVELASEFVNSGYLVID
jgi:hypothetical protein